MAMKDMMKKGKKQGAVAGGGTGDKSMRTYAAKRSKSLGKSRAGAPTAQTAPSPAMYEPKYDLDTLTKAEEIRRDPKRHSAAKIEGSRQRNRLASVLGVRRGAEPAEG